MASHTTPTDAKQLELYGAGFGVLRYEGGTEIDWISEFNDQGQPALGEPIDIMTIGDVEPRGIIPPMAVQSGTLTFTTYGLNNQGVWGTIFNGKFKNAEKLVDVFRQQLEDGAISIHWITVDVTGQPAKDYQYNGVVVTNAQKVVRVDNRGAKQATQQFTCKYTSVTQQQMSSTQ